MEHDELSSRPERSDPGSVFWRRWHPGWKLLTAVLPAVSSVMQCKSRLSSLNFLRRESRTCESVWLLMVLMVEGGCACFLLERDHHVWRLTSCHGCRASWQKVLGSHPWSSTKEPAAPPAPNSKIIRLSGFMLHKKWAFLSNTILSSLWFLQHLFWKVSENIELWAGENKMLPFVVVYISFVLQLHSVSGSEGLFQTNTDVLVRFANDQHSLGLLPQCEIEGPLTFLCPLIFLITIHLFA